MRSDDDEFVLNEKVGGVTVENHLTANLEEWKVKCSYSGPKLDGIVSLGDDTGVGVVVCRFYSNLHRLISDLKFLVTLSHPSIVSTIGYCPQSCSIVFDAAVGTPLNALLSPAHDFCFLNFANILDILRCAWAGLCYLHERKVTHNLIRSDCIYVTKSAVNGVTRVTAKLGDFYCCVFNPSHESVEDTLFSVYGSNYENLFRYSTFERIQPSGYDPLHTTISHVSHISLITNITYHHTSYK